MHRQQAHSRVRRELLHGNVISAIYASRRIADDARALPGFIDDVPQRSVWGVGSNDEHHWFGRYRRNRHELRQAKRGRPFVDELLLRQGRQASDEDEDVLAVRRSFRDCSRADRASCARPVRYDNRLFQRTRQRRRQHSAKNISQACGRGWHYQSDRTGRIGLLRGRQRANGGDSRCHAAGQQAFSHRNDDFSMLRR